MLADADVLLRPLADPAFPVEFHRHFTHSLAFVPLGAAVVAAPFAAMKEWPRAAVFVAALAAYATHPLLDACTSYGTLLYWPFSLRRVSWDCISIVDPVFTLLLLLGVTVAFAKRSRAPALVALLAATAYLSLGSMQHARALEVQREIAADRGHVVERGRTMPTLGNLIVWRSLYESGGMLHADSIRVPPLGEGELRPGDVTPVATEASIPCVSVELSAIRDGYTGRKRALEVFRGLSWFADGYISIVSLDPPTVGDARYSLVSAGFEPLWGVAFHDRGVTVEPEWINIVRRSRPAWGVLLDDLMWTDSGDDLPSN
jgi:inner membrane protein